MKKIIVALILMLCLIVPVFSSGSAETADSNTIRVLLANHPYGDLLKSKIPEFEAETGIKVNIEQLQESQLTQQLTTEFATGSSTVDVFMTRPLQEGLMFMKNGWYKAIPDYDFSDYPEGTVDIARLDGVPYFVPLVTEWEVLYYRKDLLEAAGIEVPTNMEELEAAAAVLTKDGVAGLASRGAGAAGVTQMSSYVYNFGGRYLAENNGKAVFNTPEALEAIRYYGRLIGSYGPQGITSMSWENIMPVFQAGKIAMWTDASVFYGQIIDPANTVIPAEDVGVAPFPAGPAGNTPFNVVSWAMGVSSGTKNEEAAMKFLEWATSKELAKEGIMNNITMARNSAWEDPEVLAIMNPGLVESQAAAAANGIPYDRPYMSSVGAARDLIGELIIESINTKGESANLEAIAEEKAAAVNELLIADGEYIE